MNREQLLERAVLAWHDQTCPEGSDCRSRDLHAVSAGAPVIAPLARVVDAILPQVTTVVELEALPDETVVIQVLSYATYAWQRNRDTSLGWLRAGDELSESSASLIEDGPLTVVWQPSAEVQR